MTDDDTVMVSEQQLMHWAALLRSMAADQRTNCQCPGFFDDEGPIEWLAYSLRTFADAQREGAVDHCAVISLASAMAALQGAIGNDVHEWAG